MMSIQQLMPCRIFERGMSCLSYIIMPHSNAECSWLWTYSSQAYNTFNTIMFLQYLDEQLQHASTNLPP